LRFNAKKRALSPSIRYLCNLKLLNQYLALVRPEACTQELELSRGLIEKLSTEGFEPESYRDEYRDRVLAMIDEKVKGQEISVPPNAPAPGRVIDLMAALKESMRTA